MKIKLIRDDRSLNFIMKSDPFRHTVLQSVCVCVWRNLVSLSHFFKAATDKRRMEHRQRISYKLDQQTCSNLEKVMVQMFVFLHLFQTFLIEDGLQLSMNVLGFFLFWFHSHPDVCIFCQVKEDVLLIAEQHCSFFGGNKCWKGFWRQCFLHRAAMSQTGNCQALGIGKSE